MNRLIAASERELDSPPTLKLRVITEPESLEGLRSDWSALLERSGANEPMLSPTWLIPWWQVYGQGRHLRLGLFYDDDRLVGLAPLQRRRYWYKPGIPFGRLEPLGADVDEEDGVCSDYLNVIAETGREQAVADSLARALLNRAFGDWTEYVMPAMNGEHPMVPLLCRAMEDRGLKVECTATGAAPFIALPKTWAEYLQVLPQRNRYVVNRALRDFEKWAGDEWELHEVRTPEELIRGRNILQTLHGERWQSAGSQGVFGKSRFAAFHDQVMPRLLAEGRLELLWLSVRGEPIAALYNLVANNKIYFYQSGRKMDLPKGQRPGIVMLAKAIERAIAAGRREFDFLAGTSQYKGQLAPLARPLVQIRAVPWSLREPLRRLLKWGGTRARTFLGKTLSTFFS